MSFESATNSAGEPQHTNPVTHDGRSEDIINSIHLQRIVPNNTESTDKNESRGDSELQATNDPVTPEQYYITRQSDNLIIAVCKDANPALVPETASGDIRGPMKPASGHVPSDFRDNRIMTLAHHLGDRYDIPWVLCTKWAWMKEIIKLTYGSNEEAKKSVDEGSFTLEREGAKILAEHWENISYPWQYVRIMLDSQRPGMFLDGGGYSMNDGTNHGSNDNTGSGTEQPTPESGDPDGDTTIYKTKVKYSFQFYVKERYGPHPRFLGSKTYDNPAGLEKSTPVGNVIEEINRVDLGSSKESLGLHDVLKPGFHLGPDDALRPKKLHIQSSLLLNALRSIVKYSSDRELGDEPEVFVDGLFPFPFEELYHHREELLNYKEETGKAKANHTSEQNAECNRHIDILVEYLDNEPTIQFLSARERWNRKVPTTTFTAFWLLMKPGADVYVREYGKLNAYVVDAVYGGVNPYLRSVSAESYSIHVWHLIFNGKVIKRKAKIIEVPVFDGERDIVSLPVFPTSFQDRLDDGAWRKNLIERGKKLFGFTKGPSFLEYTGTGLGTGWKKYNRARVVAEHQSLPWMKHEFLTMDAWRFTDDESPPKVNFLPGYPPPPPSPGGYRMPISPSRVGVRARTPRCECSRCQLVHSKEGAYVSPTFNDYDSIEPGRPEGLSDHQALVCMSHMFAFVLKDRAYDILEIDGLSEPTLAENAINELVLRPERNKETIKAIARTYTDSEVDLLNLDFIRGKGEGQIFLLHGPPGTGKTLTAESVAEYTKRPLLSITAADLGHEPVELETNLLRFFKDATAWDAIVLLDEADVYLERRSSNDLRRNCIVSIFLRALDYFGGILFFTTNRIGHFDEAIMSRIHVAIGYDELDDKAREQIWDTFFRKLKENHKSGGPRIEYEYDAKQYVRKSEDVKSLKWNGREIRNAFQTAVALAIADSKTAKAKARPEEECTPLLTEAHLKQIVSMSAGFKRYIKATHEGIDDADLAFRLGNRYDRLEPDSR